MRQRVSHRTEPLYPLLTELVATQYPRKYCAADKKRALAGAFFPCLFQLARDQNMCWPPLIEMLAPVTNAASSEDR